LSGKLSGGYGNPRVGKEWSAESPRQKEERNNPVAAKTGKRTTITPITRLQHAYNGHQLLPER
jgi:hypothetical protein